MFASHLPSRNVLSWYIVLQVNWARNVTELKEKNLDAIMNLNNLISGVTVASSTRRSLCHLTSESLRSAGERDPER